MSILEKPFEDLLQINTPERPLRGLNTLISAVRTWHSPHVHLLPGSIKFAIRGESVVETRTRAYRITNARFLLLNSWEPYTFTIPPGSVTQTFSLFFRPRYLASVQEAILRSDSNLLDQDVELTPYVEFPEALFAADTGGLKVRLLNLFNTWQHGGSQLCLADRVRDVGEALISLRCGVRKQLQKIDAVKNSTRQELHRRVQLASIFVRENYAQDIRLDTVARETGMAPHHLHRVFRAVNGLTLHQWIVELRMTEAKHLLETTEIPISRICSRVGYASVPSFSNLFRLRFGSPPSFYRRLNSDE